MFARIDTCFNSLTRQGTGRRYHPKQFKLYWSFIRKISRLVKSLVIVMDLRCAWLRVILGVTSGKTSPRAIGWESIWLCERRTLSQSAKPRGNISRRVTPRWHAQSNQSRYFYNASPGTRRDVVIGVDKMLRENFLNRLFFVNTKSLSPIVRAQSTIGVKKYGLRILNPVT